MQEFCYKIRNKEGLHARPAGLLIKQAGNFACSCELHGRGRSASLKGGIFAVFSLGLCAGDELILRCEGPDEELACAVLSAEIKKLF